MMGYGIGFGYGGIWMVLIYAVVVVVPFFKLWQRTGHNGWISLLMFVPLVNVVMLYYLAFKAWPAVDASGPNT